MTIPPSIHSVCRGALLLVVAVLTGQMTSGQDSPPAGGKEVKLNYPTARRVDHADDYHGTRVADPYRWLEDTDSDETKAWIEAQNKVTFKFLEDIPQRRRIKERLTQLWNYERFGLPERRGEWYFYVRNDGLQNQSVLYVTEGLDGAPRVLLDPNQLSADGTVALAGWVPSDDGTKLAYGLAAAGSDWREWKVRDVATGKDLPDHVQWVKFSGASWAQDGSGFYYSRYDEPKPGEQFTGTNYFQKLYFHRLGEPQSRDKLIYHRPDEKEWGFDGEVTEDGRFLIISVWRGSERKNQLFYKNLAAPDSAIVELIRGFDAEYQYVGNDSDTLWVLTDWEAPRRRIIAMDVRQPDRSQWRTLVPESTDVLESASVVGDYVFGSYLKDASSRVRVFDRSGRQVREVELPGLGTVEGPRGRRSDRETFYSFTSFTTPGTIYRYDLASGQSRVFRAPRVAFNPDDYESRQVFFPSKDGTRVPMFITHRRGLTLAGDHPALLYGYGGFNIPITPSFSVSTLVFLEMGGVAATVNLRGGGEYGSAWHEAGMLKNKQNVFDDFIAASEWLIENKYTCPARLAIQGRSNGGLLVGAAMAQRPELFAAALPAVGVMDMLRYHKFTIGWAWVSEYGSSDAADQFPSLLAYSPLHNLRQGTRYPATLVTTADHDDRVVPGHSFKFAAALQHAHSGDAPVLIRIETRAGHGAGTPTSKLIDTAADVLAFLVQTLQIRVPAE
jgi:prolyl oligopeptidase